LRRRDRAVRRRPPAAGGGFGLLEQHARHDHRPLPGRDRRGPPVTRFNRRGWLKASGAGLAGLWLAACDRLNASPTVTGVLQRAEGLTRRAQRLMLDRTALAKEFPASAISPDFRANGSVAPSDPAYVAHAAA